MGGPHNNGIFFMRSLKLLIEPRILHIQFHWSGQYPSETRFTCCLLRIEYGARPWYAIQAELILSGLEEV